jgi:hypothetical protein
MEFVMAAPALIKSNSVFGLKRLRAAAHPALAAAVLVLALAGCAQQRSAGYYETPRDSTLSDAQQQARSSHISQAPSQLQLGFGDTETPKKPGTPQAAPAAGATAGQEPATTDGSSVAVRPLQEAKTFLGTVPCMTGGLVCTAARVTLTLAPSGEWRSRTQMLDSSYSGKKSVTNQGCWSPTGIHPWRILLKSEDGRQTASLTFINDNVLRINTINEIKPTLDYHLTRQANIDGIVEMASQPALQCGS